MTRSENVTSALNFALLLFTLLSPNITTRKYCDNLGQLAHLSGEKSVPAVVPNSLQGRTLDWFGSTMPRRASHSLEDWITALQSEFQVNTAKARVKAKECTYHREKFKSVKDYFYKKVDLLKTASMYVDERAMIYEIRLGLPPDFSVHLHYNDIRRRFISQFGQLLSEKEAAYREMFRADQYYVERKEKHFGSR